MKLLVTGATGFIGSHLVLAAHARGWQVAAPSVPATRRHRFEGAARDVVDLGVERNDFPALRRALKSWKPDAAAHLAWTTRPGTYLTDPENVTCLSSSLDLLRILTDVGCRRVVMAGSCAEYAPSEKAVDEDWPIDPQTLYGACKASLGLIGRQLAAAAGARFVWARIFHLYGPFEDRRRVVPTLVHALLEGREFPASSGEQLRDYLHVEDVAAAFVSLLEADVDGVFNVCSGTPVSMRHLMETAARIVGRPELIRFGALSPRPWDPAVVCGASDRLRTLGWRPRYPLEEGLRQTIDWWRRRG